jgi:hypothetical protein
MAATQLKRDIIQELAELFVTRPSRKRLLEFRPSQSLQRRAQALLLKQADQILTAEEMIELNEFLYAEQLMRLVKAKIRVPKASHI